MSGVRIFSRTLKNITKGSIYRKIDTLVRSEGGNEFQENFRGFYVKLLLPKIEEITKQVRKNRWYKELTGRELERVGKFIPLFLLGKNQVKHAQNTKNTKKKG